MFRLYTFLEFNLTVYLVQYSTFEYILSVLQNVLSKKCCNALEEYFPQV